MVIADSSFAGVVATNTEMHGLLFMFELPWSKRAVRVPWIFEVVECALNLEKCASKRNSKSRRVEQYNEVPVDITDGRKGITFADDFHYLISNSNRLYGHIRGFLAQLFIASVDLILKQNPTRTSMNIILSGVIQLGTLSLLECASFSCKGERRATVEVYSFKMPLPSVHGTDLKSHASW